MTASYRKLFSWLVLFMLLISTFSPAQAAPAQQASGPVLNQAIPLISSDSSLSSLFNTNLVTNGDAEQGTGTTIPYWHDNEHYTQIIPYGQSGSYPSPYDPGPAERGDHFFYAGTASNPAIQTNLWHDQISISTASGQIDTGLVCFILSGYFGGYGSSTDTLRIRIFFHNQSNQQIGTAVVGNVTAAERLNKTGLVYREITGYIPKGTRNFDLVLQTGTLDTDSYRLAFADNLSFVMLPLQVFLPLTISAQSSAPSQLAPNAPSAVTVTANGLTRLDILWQDNSSNETGFQVERQQVDGSYVRVCNTGPGETYCLDQGQQGNIYIQLSPSTTYTYRVRATGKSTDSTWATGSGPTAPAPSTPPFGTMTCQLIDTTSTSTTLVWSDPYDNDEYFTVEQLIFPGDFNLLAKVLENGMRLTITGLQPGMSVTYRVIAHNQAGAGPACSTPVVKLPSNTGLSITRFTNNASYPIISLQVDGMEQFPVRPLGILPGGYYELELPPGTHSYTLSTGFWDDFGSRFLMYSYWDNFDQPSGSTQNIQIQDISIENLLTQFSTSGYWEGYYFDQNANCYTSAFEFHQDGTYTSYDKGYAVSTGTYDLVERMPNIYSTKFQVDEASSSYQSILIEPYGEFKMDNGPTPNWRTITYNYKPDGYVYNPFCP